MATSDKTKEFTKKQDDIIINKEGAKRQHESGKLTAEERLALLLDDNSFTEIDEFVELRSHDYGLQEKKKPRDGVITGYGTVNKKPVCIYAQDFTFMGGSMGEAHNKKNQGEIPRPQYCGRRVHE